MFLIVAQLIIFILGLAAGVDRDHRHLHSDLPAAPRHFDIDPLFFGILVAVNLQTAFLSPPMAMSAVLSEGHRASRR